MKPLEGLGRKGKPKILDKLLGKIPDPTEKKPSHHGVPSEEALAAHRYAGVPGAGQKRNELHTALHTSDATLGEKVAEWNSLHEKDFSGDQRQVESFTSPEGTLTSYWFRDTGAIKFEFVPHSHE